MPAARNQEVTVRRPWPKSRPYSSKGRRAAERFCSQWARAAKALATRGGRCENGMVGSLTRDSLSKGHRVQGAGFCPPSGDIHYSTPRGLLPPVAISSGGRMSKKFPESTDEGDPRLFPASATLGFPPRHHNGLAHA